MAFAPLPLLPQGMENSKFPRAGIVRVTDHVIHARIGGPKTTDRFRVEPFLRDDLGKHRLRIVKELPCGCALLFILQQGRITTF